MNEFSLADLKSLTGYSRLPPRLAAAHPDIARQQRDDVHGVGARLQAMQSILAGRKLGSIADLGGNSGFFCLSLIDDGMAESASVYDIDMLGETLAAGRKMAELMQLSDSINFVKQSVSLDFAENMPKVDTVICLNLLHHSGRLFDVDVVQNRGWEPYAKDWLTALCGKCRLAIIGLAFDNEAPPNWNEPAASRAKRFSKMAESAGWSVLYYANVRELERVGVEAANGRYDVQTGGAVDGALRFGTRVTSFPLLKPLKHGLKQVLRRLGLLPAIQNRTGSMGTYHFYIFERH